MASSSNVAANSSIATSSLEVSEASTSSGASGSSISPGSSAGTSATSPPKAPSFTVIVNKKLVSLIGTYKKINIVTTYAEVLDGLRIYIMEKRLYLPDCPHKIRCENDELSSVLGVKEFTISDVRKLLQKLVFPVRINRSNNTVAVFPIASTSCDTGGVKRKAEETSNELANKKSCDEAPKDSMYLYIPPSPKVVGSSSDTTESIQGYETALVKDTSDDSVSVSDDESLFPENILALGDIFDVQCDVENSCSETVNTDNSTKSKAAEKNPISFVCKSDSDEEFWADKSSDEDFNSDLEIPDSDKWACKRCNYFNNPSMRYCIKCWHMRIGWMAPKREERRVPPRRKLKKRYSKKLDKLPDSIQEDTSSGFKSSASCSSLSFSEASSIAKTDSSNSLLKEPTTSLNLPKLPLYALGSQKSSNVFPSSSQEFTSSGISLGSSQAFPSSYSEAGSSQELSTLSSYSSQESTSQPNSHESFSTSRENSQESSNTSSDLINSLNDFRTLNLSNVPKADSEAKLCLLCCSKPANASIIHGKYAHQISCYRCARKLQLENKRCPICRRTIDRVVYQIPAVSFA